MSREVYEATALRDGRFWLLRVPAVGRSTQAHRLDQAEDMVRDLVAIMTGKPADAFEVNVVVELEPELRALISEAVAAKADAAARQQAASIAQREAISRLAESGYTVRDTGRLLGLTYQRVAQLRAALDTRDSA
jgi:hypothetical protein